MEYQINNTDDLLVFIKLDDITADQATEIVCKALNVVSIFSKTKEELIAVTEYHIQRFCKNEVSERPFFLEQLNSGVNIKDFYKAEK